MYPLQKSRASKIGSVGYLLVQSEYEGTCNGTMAIGIPVRLADGAVDLAGHHGVGYGLLDSCFKSSELSLL